VVGCLGRLDGSGEHKLSHWSVGPWLGLRISAEACVIEGRALGRECVHLSGGTVPRGGRGKHCSVGRGGWGKRKSGLLHELEGG
jgi:hypothetical protein